MSDYDKLTVVKLRDELVKRGLPKSGLKAALVNRLIEADAQTTQAPVAPPAQELESTPDKNEAVITGVFPPPPPQAQNQLERGEPEDHAPQPPEIKDGETIELETQETVGTNSKEFEESSEEEDKTGNIPNENQIAPSEQTPPQATAVIREGTVAPPGEPMGEEIVKADTANETLRPSAQTPELGDVLPETNPSVLEIAPSTAESTQTSLSREEVQEDRNKRKRRSQSPIPSSIETSQKRARAEDGRPLVKLPEDTDMTDAPDPENEHSVVAGPVKDVPASVSVELQTNGHVQPHSSESHILKKSLLPGSIEIQESQSRDGNDEKEMPLQPTIAQSPVKPSPSDTRFKNLFTSSKRAGSSHRQAFHSDNEDRAVSAALHPATPALYIRDFMRPLQPGNLKDRLIALATPPDSTPSAEIISDFFLDSIRTHCLVGFDSTSAASRVRSGLHNRVWPDERTRKPLWVDFVPEEKIKKWIEVETEAASSRGQGGKRWEVVYEEEDNEMKAYLQEAGLNSSAPRRRSSIPLRAEAGQGVQGAPSGPRNRDTEPRNLSMTSKPENGKGFQALDDLFKSTTAKPKLYYQPVQKDIVQRRTDKLAAARGGGRGHEMKRYTFEEDVIVDRGPEFGMRGRGGHGGRGGGYQGGYRGRGGGGYRGEGGEYYRGEGRGGYRGEDYGGRRGDRREWR